jgi:hypothetical protein
MRGGKAVPAKRDRPPENFASLEEFWTFWDAHSTADYEDLMEEVDAEVDIQSNKIYCAVARDIVRQARAEAREQGVSTETVINLWLRDRVGETARGG